LEDHVDLAEADLFDDLPVLTSSSGGILGLLTAAAHDEDAWDGTCRLIRSP
jgi:hypothetical protein